MSKRRRLKDIIGTIAKISMKMHLFQSKTTKRKKFSNTIQFSNTRNFRKSTTGLLHINREKVFLVPNLIYLVPRVEF